MAPLPSQSAVDGKLKAHFASAGRGSQVPCASPRAALMTFYVLLYVQDSIVSLVHQCITRGRVEDAVKVLDSLPESISNPVDILSQQVKHDDNSI